MLRKAAVICAMFLLGISSVSAAVNVKGHTRKDGKYVAPYKKTAPDKTKANNYSTKGNVNPFTGELGTKNATDTGSKKTAQTTPATRVEDQSGLFVLVASFFEKNRLFYVKELITMPYTPSICIPALLEASKTGNAYLGALEGEASALKTAYNEQYPSEKVVSMINAASNVNSIMYQQYEAAENNATFCMQRYYNIK